VSRPSALFVVGARPQFVKAAAVWQRLADHPRAAAFEAVLVHSGQHYDRLLSDVFFEELPLPAPAYELGVGEAPMAEQFGQILARTDRLVAEVEPAAVVVFGDTTTTLAAALAAAYRDVPVVHVEAGERAYRRRRYPEETNRVLADHLATLCLAATDRAAGYLAAEGVAEERVRVVGDVMYDLFLWGRAQVADRPVGPLLPAGVEAGRFDLATVHRAENTDDDEVLVGLLSALDAGPRPVVLPAHPRLARRCADLGWRPRGGLALVAPVGYLDLLTLLGSAQVVVTDSGGLMREAFFARVPCVIPLAHTPWRELVESGWAVEVGADPGRLAAAVAGATRPAAEPPDYFGDGRACARVVEAVADVCGGRSLTDDWSPRPARPG
jgi:UDP-N-acetylglucosamine 2-epimerase